MKKLVYAGLAFILALVACNKKGDPPSFWYHTEGIYLRDENGTVTDIWGTPAIFNEDSNFKLMVYSNPVSDSLKFDIVNKTDEDIYYKFNMYAVDF